MFSLYTIMNILIVSGLIIASQASRSSIYPVTTATSLESLPSYSSPKSLLMSELLGNKHTLNMDCKMYVDIFREYSYQA
jgi:hypothetical protein